MARSGGWRTVLRDVGYNVLNPHRSGARSAADIKARSPIMARVKIFKKDGTPTSYFWSDDDGTEQSRKTVYKETTDGVKRMTGVHFDAAANRIQKHTDAA
jgi:hypothetical protein